MALKHIFHRILAALLISSGGLFNSAHAEIPTPQAPDTIAARVQACAICHGNQGEGTDNDYFPRLAGKPADYLYNQLKHFREGRRKYAPMNYLVTYLSDDYLREIAVYYANLRPPYPTPEPSKISQSMLAQGKKIALEGDRAKNVPACIACHGAKLTGAEPAIPGLVGLHADYISAQLGAWRSGVRHAAAPDCMHTVAIQLSDADIRAVSTWLAMQPAPPDATPAPAGSLKLPLTCGSQPH
ncbi:cytochrome C family protein [Mycoavidus cysteinexigens]|uniref:Cytochrome C family protein n=1 Tax=Mycoavidus cysteinexigens TaxID=1553431 RepID=A0A2Z6EXA8_9BURK|nr:cytochrome C family protein [Mycoavidus cysteinexigens]GAM53575.1 cytochrome c4 [bacterium endosymbiont of Mortierella elongata FMR23-6]GLR00497.1 cytochrome c [Mycoavidus cysteinexigens]